VKKGGGRGEGTHGRGQKSVRGARFSLGIGKSAKVQGWSLRERIDGTGCGSVRFT